MWSEAVPPQLYFLVSAVFHYLGPAFAVLLFAALAPLGVAWLRIVSAAVVFAVWRRPWRLLPCLGREQRWLIVALGVVLGAMNSVFYKAIARIPLGTVGAIEFLGPIALAAAGMRTRRNLAALGLGVAGVAVLTDVRIAGAPLAYVFAFGNCALFVVYVVLGHRVANSPVLERDSRARRPPSRDLAPTAAQAASIDFGLAMLVAMVAALPLGFGDALPAWSHPALLGAAVGVGVCSSVIPYACDQLAMARLPRATFALMLSLLPATATVVGVVVLRQVPSAVELGGVGLVIAGVALHRPDAAGDALKSRYARRRGAAGLDCRVALRAPRNDVWVLRDPCQAGAG